MDIPIVEVGHGIANRFPDRIEINKHLRKYPRLLKAILEHERSHADGGYSKKDFMLDFTTPSKASTWDILKFMVKHPSAFTQVLPIYWTKRTGIVYDINLFILYGIMVGIFTGVILVGVKFL